MGGARRPGPRLASVAGRLTGQLADDHRGDRHGEAGELHRAERLVEQRAGLVRRTPDPADRRGLRVILTESGRRVVEESVDAGLAVQRRILDALPPEDQARLADLLRTLLAAAEAGG